MSIFYRARSLVTATVEAFIDTDPKCIYSRLPVHKYICSRYTHVCSEWYSLNLGFFLFCLSIICSKHFAAFHAALDCCLPSDHDAVSPGDMPSIERELAISVKFTLPWTDGSPFALCITCWPDSSHAFGALALYTWRYLFMAYSSWGRHISVSVCRRFLLSIRAANPNPVICFSHTYTPHTHAHMYCQKDIAWVKVK